MSSQRMDYLAGAKPGLCHEACREGVFAAAHARMEWTIHCRFPVKAPCGAEVEVWLKRADTASDSYKFVILTHYLPEPD